MEVKVEVQVERSTSRLLAFLSNNPLLLHSHYTQSITYVPTNPLFPHTQGLERESLPSLHPSSLIKKESVFHHLPHTPQ